MDICFSNISDDKDEYWSLRTFQKSIWSYCGRK